MRTGDSVASVNNPSEPSVHYTAHLGSYFAFGLSEGYFLRLQNAYDSLEAKRRIAAQLAKIEPYKAPEA
jgi:plasmid maintenance system antidote protein VapI